MKARSSWRIYKNEKLGEEDRNCIEEYIEEDHEAPFGNKSRFKLVDRFSDDGRIGTCGFIRGTQHYIVGAAGDSSMSVEAFGYVFEKIILYATGLGLGICWLGGTFIRKAVIDALGLWVMSFCLLFLPWVTSKIGVWVIRPSNGRPGVKTGSHGVCYSLMEFLILR